MLFNLEFGIMKVEFINLLQEVGVLLDLFKSISQWLQAEILTEISLVFLGCFVGQAVAVPNIGQ